MQIALLGDKVVTTHVLARHTRGTVDACNERTWMFRQMDETGALSKASKQPWACDDRWLITVQLGACTNRSCNATPPPVGDYSLWGLVEWVFYGAGCPYCH